MPEWSRLELSPVLATEARRALAVLAPAMPFGFMLARLADKRLRLPAFMSRT